MSFKWNRRTGFDMSYKEEQKHKSYEEEKVRIRNARKKLETARKLVAIDCEMVGVSHQKNGDGHHLKDGRLKDALARVSVVNSLGEVLLDRYCLPKEEIIDYRTQFSGIRMEDLEGASDFETVQAEVLRCLYKCTTIVGHSIENDFKVLKINELLACIRVHRI